MSVPATMREQARRIVILAAESIAPDVTEPRLWLQRDERGTWETMAADLVTTAEPKRIKLGLSVEQMERETATVLAHRALTTCLAAAEKRGDTTNTNARDGGASPQSHRCSGGRADSLPPVPHPYRATRTPDTSNERATGEHDDDDQS